MKDKTKALIILIVVGVAGLMLAQKLFPSSSDFPAPTSAQLPFLIVLGIIEALAMGGGFAYLIVYWKMAAAEKNLLVHVALFWLMGSWWVHDGLHRMNGHELSGLIKIEYGFHLTLIVASFIVASHILKKYLLQPVN